MPLLLLMLFSIAFAIGLGLLVVLLKRPRIVGPLPCVAPPEPQLCIHPPSYSHRPTSWLAIKSKSIENVQAALKLHNPRPCPLAEGLAGEMNLFIAPPLRGWILVIGSGLPDPADDVDACFRFLAGLSRKLGEVQFFSANPVVQHHAWIRIVRGSVQRAFSWAGQTLWSQGRLTGAEMAAGVICPDYTEDMEDSAELGRDFPAANVEKVPLISARWSLDPGSLDPTVLQSSQGIAGEWRNR